MSCTAESTTPVQMVHPLSERRWALVDISPDGWRALSDFEYDVDVAAFFSFGQGLINQFQGCCYLLLSESS